MFSGRQIWMVTTNRRRSQVATAMVIHLLSLTKSIREQQTQTLMEKAWTNGRKALIKSPRLQHHLNPVLAFHKLHVGLSEALLVIYLAALLSIMCTERTVIDLEILIIIIQAPSALRAALRCWALRSYTPKLFGKAKFKNLSHTSLTTAKKITITLMKSPLHYGVVRRYFWLYKYLKAALPSNKQPTRCRRRITNSKTSDLLILLNKIKQVMINNGKGHSI